MHYLASELREGRLPLWTDLIGCGFPIFAEGQIAALYPLNLLFYGLLPFKIAYNYSTLFHFWLGGLFCYLFARSLNLSRIGSFLASFIYLFGSCQGGYFYNMNSQKTVIWFPLVLLLMERLLKTRNWLYVLWIGIIFGVQINAGYLQIAFYSLVFAMFYFLLRQILDRGKEGMGPILGRFLMRSMGIGIVTLMVALPQLLATIELSRFSSRTGLPESFAYVGSLAPQGFFTLLFPFLDNFLGHDLYFSLFAFLLLPAAFLFRRDWSVQMRCLFWLGILAFLVALGQFSPLYVGIVKLTHFYGFRVPAKVLYFAGFSAAILMGFGWDSLRQSEDPRSRKAGWIFLSLMALAFIFSIGGRYLIEALTPALKDLGSWILTQYYVGSPLHIQSAEAYLGKLDHFLEKFLRVVSISEGGWMRWWSLFFVLHLMWVGSFLFYRKIRKWSLIAIIPLLGADLYLYSFTSIRGNGEVLSEYFSPAQPFVEYLQKDAGPYRIYEYSTDLAREERFPLIFNLNMFYGLSDVGIYSPLALESHRNFFKGLGANSNSLFVSLTDPKKAGFLKPLLDLSNAKYMLGTDIPDAAGWEKRVDAGGFQLYENPSVLPRAFWMPYRSAKTVPDFNAYVRSSGAFDPGKELLFEGPVPVIVREAVPKRNGGSWKTVPFDRSESESVRFTPDFSEDGWLFLSDIDYPGWTAVVNGKTSPIWRANGIFRTVFLPKGECRVEFSYRPYYKPFLPLPFIVLAVTVLTSGTLGLSQLLKRR